ncbi:MAG: trehalase-like domain-containing protein, partial [Acidimicrobiales bacterium]
MSSYVVSEQPSPARVDGYALLGSYAALGDGRTVALVALDGSVDWLCLPDLDSPALFAALLDSTSGGSFILRPAVPFRVSRRYLPGTNVLETMFVTATGTVRVTDAMTVPDEALSPQRELVRAVEAVQGQVPMCWEVTPRFGFGSGRTRVASRGATPVATSGSDAVAVCTWGAGEPRVSGEAVSGRFDAIPGNQVILALSAAHQEPLVIPAARESKARLAHTAGMWRRWSEGLRPLQEWQDPVVRSALALKLLVHAPSGAIAAAATASLPETVGGGRNWDYRFC